jgi:hypothetical protein
MTASKVVTEVLWTLSNIAANGSNEVEQIMECEEGKLFRTILDYSEKSNGDIVKEVMWVVCNMVTECNEMTRVKILEFDGSKILLVLIAALSRFEDSRLLSNVLEAIECIL